MVNDIRCSGQGMEKATKFDKHPWHRNIKTNCIFSKFLPWEYLKIISSLTKETLDTSERDQSYHYVKIK